MHILTGIVRFLRKSYVIFALHKLLVDCLTCALKIWLEPAGPQDTLKRNIISTQQVWVDLVDSTIEALSMQKLMIFILEQPFPKLETQKLTLIELKPMVSILMATIMQPKTSN